jgi:hypothetical protein
MNRKGIQSFLSILIIGIVLIVGCSKTDKDSVYLQEPLTGSQEADALAETRDYIEDLAAKDQFSGAVLMAGESIIRGSQSRRHEIQPGFDEQDVHGCGRTPTGRTRQTWP